MRLVLTNISTLAQSSGGWPDNRAANPDMSARGRSTPGATAKTRAVSDGSNILRPQHFIGQHQSFGAADVAPVSLIGQTKKTILFFHDIPEAV